MKQQADRKQQESHARYRKSEFPRRSRGSGDGPLLDRLADPPLARDPAEAGMDLRRTVHGEARRRKPRGRGDGPLQEWAGFSSELETPRTRGWAANDLSWPEEKGGDPADAGMDRAFLPSRPASTRRPRGRGDGPVGAAMGIQYRVGDPADAGIWTSYASGSLQE